MIFTGDFVLIMKQFVWFHVKHRSFIHLKTNLTNGQIYPYFTTYFKSLTTCKRLKPSVFYTHIHSLIHSLGISLLNFAPNKYRKYLNFKSLVERKRPEDFKIEVFSVFVWCGQGESNSRLILGKDSFYH